MSDIGELRRAAAEARTEFDRASNAAGFARTSRVNYEFAEKQWRLSKPQEASVREPRLIVEGAAHWDIPMRPPPTDEEVTALEGVAAKAEKQLAKARKALTAAAALSPPKRKPSPTGYAAVKSFRFLGQSYDPGDPFDASVAEPVKFAKLIGSRKVAPTSLPGHAS